MDNGVEIFIDGCPLRAVYGAVPTSPYPEADLRLVSVPDPSEASFDPTDGKVSSSRMSFTVSANDIARKTLLVVAGRPAGQTVGATSAGSTGIALSVGLGAGVVGRFAWLNDEVVRIEAVVGGTITCTRGINSTPQAHPEGTFLWLGPPKLRRQPVTMTVWKSGVSLGSWRGLVDTMPTQSDDGARITVQCSGVLAISKNILAGQGNPRVSIALGAFSYELSGILASTPRNDKPYFQPRSIRVGGTLATSYLPDSTGYTQQSSLGFGLLDTPPIFDGLTEAEQRQIPIHEVLAAGRALRDYGLTFGDPNANHPLHIAATFLGIYGNLNPPWDAGLGRYFSSDVLATVDEIISATPEYVANHWILGWSGEPYAILEEVREALTFWGIYLVEGADGRLSFARFRVGSVLDTYPTLPVLKDRLTWEGPPGGAADRVMVSIGGLPFRGGSNLLFVPRQGQLSPWESQGEQVQFSANTIAIGRSQELIEGRLLSLANQRSRGQPRLSIKLRSSATPPRLGQVYRLADPVGLEEAIFPKSDGTVTASLSEDSFIGWAVAVRWIPREGTYEVTVQLNNWAVNLLLKLRAPSAIIDSPTDLGGGTYFVTLLDEDLGSGLGSPGLVFEQGQRVQVWTDDGVLVGSGNGTIDSVGGSTLVISGLSAEPLNGQVIRLSREVAQPVDHWVSFDNSDLYE